MDMKDKFKKVNPKVPPILLMVVPVLLAALFAFYVYMPMLEEKAQLEDQISTVRQKVEEGRLKVRKLDELMKANEKLNQDLMKAQEILPTSEQLTALLETISGFVKETGLELKDWKRETSVTDSTKLYTETVIKVEVVGSYHELGKFMEKLDSLARLVTVSNLEMSSAKLSGYEMSIPIRFTLIAYSAAGGK